MLRIKQLNLKNVQSLNNCGVYGLDMATFAGKSEKKSSCSSIPHKIIWRCVHSPVTTGGLSPSKKSSKPPKLKHETL